MKKTYFVMAIFAFRVISVYADTPLIVEDLITGKDMAKLDFSLTYANSDRQGISTGEPTTIQTGTTSFVTLPTLIGVSRSNSDSVVGTLGLRYGLTTKAEIFARTSYLQNSTRTSDVTGTGQSGESYFTDTWAGINYQFKKDDDTPAIMGFAEIALRDKHQYNSSSFKSALVGLTTYKAIDPVVFSFTTAYRLNQSRRDGTFDYLPGNLLLLNNSIGFAVNDRVTLTTGMQWMSRHADKLNDKVQGFRRTSIDLLLGVGYGIAKGNTINLTFKSNVSGSNGADLRLNWLHTF